MKMETFRYDDKIARLFFGATILWAVVGMLVGVLIAAMLFMPSLNLAPYVTFGRLRPLHTNAVIFAFCGNLIFAGVYHSIQRLLKTRTLHRHPLEDPLLGLAAADRAGRRQPGPRDHPGQGVRRAALAARHRHRGAVGDLRRQLLRHHRHPARDATCTSPSGSTSPPSWRWRSCTSATAWRCPTRWLGSYSAYSGVKDALMQWWYGHNAVAFFLTTPFLGLMYYYLPKAANRPVFSYKLSILHFWALVFVYIWAGPHHLHYTALPEWASTLGMLFSLILWMPSWGGMVNGLFTLRGAWDKVREDPVLKFLVVAVTYYGMSTFEGPMMSIKSVNAVSHYTDWTIGHVHAGTLGWNAFMAFGILYWVVPRLWQDRALQHDAGDRPLLDRHHRPDPLPGLDVGRGHHPVGHVARLRARRSPHLPRLHRDRRARSCRCTGCACSAALLFFTGLLLGSTTSGAPCARPPRATRRTTRSRRRARETDGRRRARGDHRGQHLRPRPLPLPARDLATASTASSSGASSPSPCWWPWPWRSARWSRRCPMFLDEVERQDHRQRSSPTPRWRCSGATSTSARAATTATRRWCAPSATRRSATASTPRPASSSTTTPSSGGPSAPGRTCMRVGGKYPHLWHVRHMDEPAVDDAAAR